MCVRGIGFLILRAKKLLVYSDYTNSTNNTTKVKRCTVIKYTFVYKYIYSICEAGSTHEALEKLSDILSVIFLIFA